VVVGQHDRGTDEDAVAELRRLVHQGVVLNLDPVADPDTGADVGAPPHHAVVTEHGLLTDLGELPHGRAGAQRSRLVDLGPGCDPDRSEGHFTVVIHVLWNDPAGLWVRGLGPFGLYSQAEGPSPQTGPRLMHAFPASSHT
jgi:hypothetical protein